MGGLRHDVRRRSRSALIAGRVPNTSRNTASRASRCACWSRSTARPPVATTSWAAARQHSSDARPARPASPRAGRVERRHAPRRPARRARPSSSSAAQRPATPRASEPLPRRPSTSARCQSAYDVRDRGALPRHLVALERDGHRAARVARDEALPLDPQRRRPAGVDEQPHDVAVVVEGGHVHDVDQPPAGDPRARSRARSSRTSTGARAAGRRPAGCRRWRPRAPVAAAQRRQPFVADRAADVG